MKKFIPLIAVLLGFHLFGAAQTFKLKRPGGEEVPVTDNMSISGNTLPIIALSVDGGSPPYNIKYGDTVIGIITSDTPAILDASKVNGLDENGFLGRDLTITNQDNTIVKKFRITPTESLNPTTGNTGTDTETDTGAIRLTSTGFLSGLFPQSVRKGSKMGIIIKEGAINTAYSGHDYTHIFYDFMGNLIFSTVPQGVSNRSYVIHVVYPMKVSDIGTISYSVDQTGGTFSSDLYFRNTEAFNDPTLLQAAVRITWAHQEFLLGTATDDLSYEIVRREVKSDGSIKKFVVTQATLNMSPVYQSLQLI